jgi:hypothetical protein
MVTSDTSKNLSMAALRVPRRPEESAIMPLSTDTMVRHTSSSVCERCTVGDFIGCSPMWNICSGQDHPDIKTNHDSE